MEAIYIPNLLRAKERTQSLLLDDFIPGIETLTPLRGKMTVRHGGTFLEIAIQAETIITLTCDRCLQQYNHRLFLDTTELIWLEKRGDSPPTLPPEREIAWEDLSETLSPEAYFEPETWLYEQLSLAIPLRKLCGKNCQQPVSTAASSEPLADSRWASLEFLRQQLSQ